MSIYNKKNGVWQKAESIYKKKDGLWKEMGDIYVKNGGTWKHVHPDSGTGNNYGILDDYIFVYLTSEYRQGYAYREQTTSLNPTDWVNTDYKNDMAYYMSLHDEIGFNFINIMVSKDYNSCLSSQLNVLLYPLRDHLDNLSIQGYDLVNDLPSNYLINISGKGVLPSYHLTTTQSEIDRYENAMSIGGICLPNYDHYSVGPSYLQDNTITTTLNFPDTQAWYQYNQYLKTFDLVSKIHGVIIDYINNNLIGSSKDFKIVFILDDFYYLETTHSSGYPNPNWSGSIFYIAPLLLYHFFNQNDTNNSIGGIINYLNTLLNSSNTIYGYMTNYNLSHTENQIALYYSNYINKTIDTSIYNITAHTDTYENVWVDTGISGYTYPNYNAPISYYNELNNFWNKGKSTSDYTDGLNNRWIYNFCRKIDSAVSSGNLDWIEETNYFTW